MGKLTAFAAFCAVVIMALTTLAFAHADGDELAEGKELFDSGASCDKLTDEQLEVVGEYLMEQMHPGEAHDGMHKMMGIEEGTPYHDQFHVNLAQAMYCNSEATATTGAAGMMGAGGMMPMMRMMPMMSAMAGQSAQGMMGGFGYGSGFSSTYSNLVNAIFLLLLIGLLGIVYFWLIRLWRGQGKKIATGTKKEK